MRKIKKISRCMLWVFTCLLLVTIKSCGDNQSNKAIFIDDFEVVLYYDDPQDPYPPSDLDFWKVSPDEEGRDITRIAHAYSLQLVKDGEPYDEASIRVDVEVTDHGSIAGFGDIWEDSAPGGEQYGFLACYPGEGSGMYEGVLHGRTDGRGKLLICCGLGDPEGVFDPNDPLDYDYELPGPGGGYDDVFDTWVELKITVPRKHMPMQAVYVWATFNRMQYQNMWEPLGGVYGNSDSGLGHWGGMSMQGLSESDIPVIQMTPRNRMGVVKEPKDRSADYPVVGSKIRTMNTTSSSGPTLDSLDLTQLRWDYVEPYGWGWYYFLIQYGEDLHALWLGDPNDPNDVVEMLSCSEPYAYWADVTLPEPFYGDSATTTVILRALDDLDTIRSKIPLTMNLYDKSPDHMTLTFMSDWFIISEDPNFHGHYQDKWGNPYTVIYMPELTYPDVDFSEPFGDFNADDKVDYVDLGLFVGHWLDSANDVNTTYDAMYEEPNNRSGSIDFRDFSVLAENWLWQAGG